MPRKNKNSVTNSSKRLEKQFKKEFDRQFKEQLEEEFPGKVFQKNNIESNIIDTIIYNWINIIKLAIDTGILKNIKFPILSVAVSLKRNEILKLLIESPDIKLNAIYNGEDAHITTKLGNKKNVSMNGYTAAHEAVRVENKFALNLFHQKGLIDIPTQSGHTAMHLSILMKKFLITDFLLLLGHCIDIPIRPKSDIYSQARGLTILSYVILKNDMKAFEFLIHKPQNLEQKSQSGHAALHIAIQNKDEKNRNDIVQQLLEKNALLDTVTNQGYTALALAAMWNKPSTVKLLLDQKADITIKNAKGYTALKSSLNKETTFDVAIMLIKHSNEIIDTKTLEFVLRKLNSEIIDAVYKQSNPQSLENLKIVVSKKFIFAILNNKEKIIEFLLNDITTLLILKEQNFSLDICAKIGRTDYLPKMLEHDVDLNRVYKDGVTALSISIAFRHQLFANSLINSGANVNIADKNGVTPAHLASAFGMLTVLKSLIAKSPDLLKCTDNNSGTALDYARFGGHENCIDYLENLLDIHPNPEEAEIKVGDVADIEVQQECVVTEQEEDQYSFIQKQIHKYYQLQKLGVNQLDNDKIIESWVIGEEVFSSSSERVSEISNDYGNKVYFAISDKISSAIEVKYGAVILKKFNSAILNGFVGKCAKAGVRDIDHKLYELKILSSICGKLRLYTTIEYINLNGEKLVVLDKMGNHRDVSSAIEASNGITEEAVVNPPNVGLSVLIKASDINPHDIFKQCLQSCIDNSDIFNPNENRAVLDLIGAYTCSDADAGQI